MSSHGTVHHIEIYVSNLSKTKEFWGWLLSELGYKLTNEWTERVTYKLQETYLVFVQTEDKYLDVAYHRKRTGLNHIAFHVKSRAKVDEFTNQLKGRNVEILYNERHPYAGGKNYYAVFFEDPDRIKVELVASDTLKMN